ncbi:hypothetical protein CEXT_626741 [Caerostris extrusa]|uniref:Uncharacterized protein n=1 Tax=Caerostris extrusa TaxID=172846 RepID=A0AAV4NQD9_CAEEX|nr:hypothetical protein CEXT_626741 [Caerostris extrusa]
MTCSKEGKFREFSNRCFSLVARSEPNSRKASVVVSTTTRRINSCSDNNLLPKILEPYACESSGHELTREVVVFGETVPSAESLGWLFGRTFEPQLKKKNDFAVFKPMQ